MKLEITAEIRDHIERSLAEDLGPQGDLTTNAIFDEKTSYTARIIGKQKGIVCGVSVAQAVFEALHPTLKTDIKIQDGQPFASGDTLLSLHGPARTILTGERVALNYLQHLSGIATLTRRYTDAIAGTQAKLLDTRKTIPGLRMLEKYAVRCGGGENHRLNLSERIMIKDNHIAAAGDIRQAYERVRNAGVPVQIECDTLEQLAEVLETGADYVLLDNMDLETLRRAVNMVNGRIRTEASGGVTLKTIRQIAETGVDFISVGRITQSAPALDLSLEIIEN